jgi:hypothetical protein
MLRGKIDTTSSEPEKSRATDFYPPALTKTILRQRRAFLFLWTKKKMNSSQSKEMNCDMMHAHQTRGLLIVACDLKIQSAHERPTNGGGDVSLSSQLNNETFGC